MSSDGKASQVRGPSSATWTDKRGYSVDFISSSFKFCGS